MPLQSISLVLTTWRWLLPERFGHAPQVFILLLEPLQLGQDLGEFPAGALRVLAVPHQVTTNVEEERAPGQQHQGNPTPWTRPGPHGATSPTKKCVLVCLYTHDPLACLPDVHTHSAPRHHKCHSANLGICMVAGVVYSKWQMWGR